MKMKQGLQGGASVLASRFLERTTTARGDARPAKLVLLLAALVLFFAVGATAQTNSLSDTEIQGRLLAQQLCDAKPETNLTQSGILSIRYANGNKTNFSVSFKIHITEVNWKAGYFIGNNAWIIKHQAGEGNRYVFVEHNPDINAWNPTSFLHSDGNETSVSFANSDFWLCDLGLEFFHWPAQKVLPKTTSLKRGREYTLLESANPNPPTNSYSRVLSWIDKESGGMLAAEAYDAKGKLLKEFEPKSFKKVNGQWLLQEMEIRNVQTGSRTRLEFDLKN